MSWQPFSPNTLLEKIREILTGSSKPNYFAVGRNYGSSCFVSGEVPITTDLATEVPLRKSLIFCSI
jgi:hypothetical protein